MPHPPRWCSRTNTGCCAADRGPHGRARSATASAIGIIPFAVRSSAEFGARAMTRSNTAAALSRDVLAAMRRRRAILDEVREGLSRPQKQLSPKFFYDARGSQLFEEITRLPEYYLTRAEREILLAYAGDIACVTGARTLVELGAGSAAKTR